MHITLVTAITSAVIGFLLAQIGNFTKIWADDYTLHRRKLNRLVFFLLELRHIFTLKQQHEKLMVRLMPILEYKAKEIFGELDQENSEPIKASIKQIFTSRLTHNNEDVKHLIQTAEATINELSEYYPVLAYELKGQHNIPQRLEAFQDYITWVGSHSSEAALMLNELLEPSMEVALNKQLGETVLKISKKTSRSLYKLVLTKIAKQDEEPAIEKKDIQELEQILIQIREKAILPAN